MNSASFDERCDEPRPRPPLARRPEDPDDELLTLEAAERRHIERVLHKERGSVERAATRLGISRSTLYQKLRRIRERDAG
ncbi:MAG TPA: helix-turn-helix domain-containing protein [Kofleriaceae bacterium]|jgi:DNA-binding NtrC family response regulator